MHDVFISYSHVDRQTATIVLNILEQNGIRCWIDYRDAIPGENYAGSIVRAIKTCRYFVLVLSQASSASQHVLNEVNSAVNAGATIIPFRLDEVQINENLEYYLGKNHWLDALTRPIETHVNKLVKVIAHYSQAPLGDEDIPPSTQTVDHSFTLAQPQPSFAALSAAQRKAGCAIHSFEELLAMGYTAETIAQQLVENDYITFNGIGTQNEGTAQQWAEFLQNNSDTFVYLVDEQNHIVGDWSIVALPDDVYDQAVHGQMVEEDLDTDTTEMICLPGIYNGYILAISLLPEHRSVKNYNLLIDSFFHQLEVFSEDGIFFRRWCINVFSKEVEALVRSLGFRYQCPNRVFGKLYELPFLPLPDAKILQRYPRMRENYRHATD